MLKYNQFTFKETLFRLRYHVNNGQKVGDYETILLHSYHVHSLQQHDIIFVTL